MAIILLVYVNAVTPVKLVHVIHTFLAGFVNGIHFQGLTLLLPILAFICLYPWFVSVGMIGGASLKDQIIILTNLQYLYNYFDCLLNLFQNLTENSTIFTYFSLESKCMVIRKLKF